MVFVLSFNHGKYFLQAFSNLLLIKARGWNIIIKKKNEKQLL